ncbi:hypothetical protein ACFYWP_03710 [Actinacidiphila glaucinigra]|uniref:hypothetical protein n=1 Tax=Actinacidiphila glaucinigra TaxID=235986 RepID=UPI0036A8FFCD
MTAHAVSDGVRLGWNDVADAGGYLVYRWDRDTGRYESVTPEPVTGTAWTDTTAASPRGSRRTG